MIRPIEIWWPYFSGGWRVTECSGDEEWVRRNFVGDRTLAFKGDSANRYYVHEIRDHGDRIVVMLRGPIGAERVHDGIDG